MGAKVKNSKIVFYHCESKTLINIYKVTLDMFYYFGASKTVLIQTESSKPYYSLNDKPVLYLLFIQLEI